MVNPSVWVGYCLLLVAIPFSADTFYFYFFLVFFFFEMVIFCVGVGERKGKKGNTLACYCISSEVSVRWGCSLWSKEECQPHFTYLFRNVNDELSRSLALT